MLKEEELNNICTYYALCELCPCEINGVFLEYEDFGTKEDIAPEEAEPYGCGNMQFIPFDDVKEEILKKYNITEEEYEKIQEKLNCLSFGECGWCI